MAPLNSYFLQGSPSEQRLVQDLINEQLSIYGQDVVYMPRKIITEEKVIKEITVSKFDDSFRIEAYISTFDGYGGNGDMLSKFGIRSTDEITFVISKERYADFITPKINLFKSEVKTADRPQEGDLIYLPLDNSLFEIKYVEMKAPFYQLNNLYVYELRCELFEYEDEIIDTDIAEVDESVQDFGYIQTLVMVNDTTSIAAAANAIDLHASLVGSRPGLPEYGVAYIDIINGGSGYSTPPEVRFKKPGGFGQLPTVEAILDRGSISKVLISYPGIGYTFAPEVTFHGGGGVGAAATAVIAKGIPFVGLTTGGVGYSTAPNVYITNPVNPSDANGFESIFNPKYITRLNSEGTVVSILAEQVGGKYDEHDNGSGLPPSVSLDPPSAATSNNQTATATATIGAGGTITAINISSGGLGYGSTPSITVSKPLTKTLTEIETVAIQDPGFAYTTARYVLRPASIGASGTGAVVDVVSIGGSLGEIGGVSIVERGTGFAVGEDYHIVGVITATTITNNLLGTAGLALTETPTSGTADDGFWELSMPFNSAYAGFSTNIVYVGTNNYLTFAAGSNQHSNISATNPSLPKIMMQAADNSVQRVYFGTEGTAPNRTYRIRSEGTSSTSGSPGSPNMVYEAVFYEAHSERVDIHTGELSRTTGVSGAYSINVLVADGNLGVANSGTRLESDSVELSTDGLVRITDIVTQQGVQATATATVSAGGTISNITLSNPGSGYRTVPTVTFESSAEMAAGSFEFNETVTGQTSGVTGVVKSWDHDNRTLKVSIVSGSFQKGELIVGAAATHKISSITLDDIYDDFAENEVIETEADKILDFTEINPFGEL